MDKFDPKKAIITTDERRRDFVRQFIAQGCPAAMANECVDLSFAAVNKAVDAVVSVCSHTTDVRVQIQTMIMAMRIAAIEFEAQAQNYEDAGKDLARELGLDHSTIVSKGAQQAGGQ